MKNSLMHKINRREWIILIICLLIGFALRYYTFDRKSLWLDEIYTYNDARYGLKDQLKYYQEKPDYLHPPLFFILTHFFYPTAKPERDLRILPLIFGTLSIPMIYLLSRSFSPSIALPCTLSLTFMAYHISLSQDGRSYTLILFFGMTGLYFFMSYLKTLKRIYLILVAIPFALMLHASYSSIPFIIFSQILWLYRAGDVKRRPPLSSFFMLNGLILLFCLPWIIFIGAHYKGQVIMDPFHTEDPGSLWSIFYRVLSDWVPLSHLTFVSVLLLILFPFVSKDRKNVFVLLAAFVFPITGLYAFCKLLSVTHFITSRYFINFLPLFFIILFLSVTAIEVKFLRLRRVLRLRFLLVILFITSNLVVLPLYYRFQKQDLRGLATYLKNHLREDDKIIDVDVGYVPGILHYFGVYPEGRQYSVPFYKVSDHEIELRTTFTYQDKKYTIYCSRDWCTRYLEGTNRLWIVAGKKTAKKLKSNSLFALKGYFDGSFLNFDRFPTDASIYLFLWDPQSPNERGIPLPVE